MTPDEQHAWEVIKALAEKRKVEFHDGKWWHCIAENWTPFTIQDIMENPEIYRVAKKEQP